MRHTLLRVCDAKRTSFLRGERLLQRGHCILLGLQQAAHSISLCLCLGHTRLRVCAHAFYFRR